jgi:hypothetical protein
MYLSLRPKYIHQYSINFSAIQFVLFARAYHTRGQVCNIDQDMPVRPTVPAFFLSLKNPHPTADSHLFSQKPGYKLFAHYVLVSIFLESQTIHGL